MGMRMRIAMKWHCCWLALLLCVCLYKRVKRLKMKTMKKSSVCEAKETQLQLSSNENGVCCIVHHKSTLASFARCV